MRSAETISRAAVHSFTRGWLLGVFLLIGFLPALFAQIEEQLKEKRYRIDVLTTEHGLPSGVVNAVLQSSEGYLWLGTANGLVRFDGIRMVPITAPELISSRISVLFEDANKTLWIGTEGGGVVSYRDREFKNFSTASGLASDSISAITADNQGNVWVATVGGALNRFRSGEFTPYTAGTVTGTIESLADGGGGSVWWCTGTALGSFREGEFGQPRLESEDRLRIGGATPSGFWLIEKRTLRRWSSYGPAEEVWELPAGLDPSSVSTMFRDQRDGGLWIGTFGMGLYHFKESTGTFRRFTTESGLSQNSILAIGQDKDGNLWVGTNGGGLNRLRESSFEVYDAKRGLSQDNVLSISGGSDGSVWIGTDGGGLNRLRDGIVQNYRMAGLRTVWSVMEDSASYVWAGTREGLYKFNGITFARIGGGPAHVPGNLPNQDVRVVYEDRKRRLWVGTFGGGLTRMVDGRASKTFNSKSDPTVFNSDDVRALLEDSEGTLWIGTGGGGLIRFKNSEFVVFRRNEVGSDFIRAIMQDREGVLWIGTNNGLTCLRRGRFFRFTTADFLPDDVISQVFEDGNGNLWLGTNRGVVRVSRNALLRFADGRVKSYASVLYDRSDGLAGRECNGGFQPWGYQADDGKLWFPSSEGVSVIDPSTIRPNPRPPLVVIENVVADGIEVEPRRITNTVDFESQTVYRIPAGTGRLEVRYTGLSFVSPRRIRFSYQLKGVDAGFVENESRRSAVYQDPPHGNYSFQVIASNSDGMPNTIGKTVGVLVMPRFYETLWFQFGMVVMVIFFGFAFFRYLSVRKLRQRLVVLEQQRALDRERTRIAQDMHDDLGARVTRIGLLTELVRRKAPQNEEMEKVSTRIEEATREVVHTLDEIVWAVNPKNDTLDRLAAFIAQYAEDYFDEVTPIRCRLDLPTNLPPVPLSAEMRHSLFLVVKESLNNIAKHSGATEVRISLTYAQPRLEILVEDNGKGFSLADADPTRNGLVNMKKRIEEGGGKLELRSEKGKGTSIRLEVKLGT
ncbi:MAG TPA: two-component regulator propeller domain-containing protein [Verrucomicrobiae bacterium]